LAAISLRQVWRENGFLFHLVCWSAASVFLFAVNFLTTGLGKPWSLWPFATWGAVVLVHAYLSLIRGRQRYSADHNLAAARQRQTEEASEAEDSPCAELHTKLLGSLTSARDALRGAAPEVTADLSRGETHALTALAWLKSAERMLSRGETIDGLRQEAVDLLSRPGLGATRVVLEALHSEIDLHEAALGALDREASRRQSILESFILALEGAGAAKDREDLLAAVTGPIRDRVTLLESALTAGSAAPPSLSPTGEAATERIREEVDLARQLQRSILPEEAPRVPGLAVTHLYRPSSEVGGDFYDFYSLGSDRLLVAIGDASGHGLDSSMVSSMAKSALYTHVSSGRNLSETMAEMNHMMWDTLGKQRLMTLALLEIDSSRRQLAWVNAGQVFPLLRSSDGVRELEAPSYPLGVRRKASYEVRHEQLEAGDVLLVFTDGYVEALDRAGEPFGWERLSDRLRTVDGDHTDRIVAGLSEALWQHLGEGQPQDDVTLIAIGLEP
jgi:serine phosphatase RsbU (regulator of sigma subunit)